MRVCCLSSLYLYFNLEVDPLYLLFESEEQGCDLFASRGLRRMVFLLSRLRGRKPRGGAFCGWFVRSFVKRFVESFGSFKIFGDLIVKVKVKVVRVKSEFMLFLLFYREINRAMKRSFCWSSFVQTNYFGNFLDL